MEDNSMKTEFTFFIFEIIISAFTFLPQNPPIYPSISFFKSISLFSLLLHGYMYIHICIANYNLLSLDVTHTSRADYLVLDNQLACYSLRKTYSHSQHPFVAFNSLWVESSDYFFSQNAQKCLMFVVKK